MFKIFAVFDSKASAFLQPFFSPTTATGMRAFESACKDENQMFARHPEDFTLFELGDWDPAEGSFEAHESKRSLGTALEFVSRGLEVVK